MVFTTYEFLILLVVAAVLYYTLPRSFQWKLLLAASAVFYAYSGLDNLIYLAVTIISVYLATRRMDDLLAEQARGLAADIPGENAKAYRAAIKRRRRRLMVLCLVLNLGILVVIKYTAFAVQGADAVFHVLAKPEDLGFFRFALPLGLSFYTFQSVSYVIDSYRAKKAGYVERNPFKLALFISFFPQMVQGPISRFGDLKQTLFERHAADADAISAGALRVFFGFFKKLVIADRLMPVIRALTAPGDEFAGAYVLLTALVYAVTLYCDFTGGIDVTIGTARIFGVKLAENFDRPFYSKSVAEYWRRWHITMGTWFRDYIFYPLSASKPMIRLIKPARRLLGDHIGKRLPVYIATMVTWFATGLWHGAAWNFIVWGVLNGAVILISQELTPLYGKFRSKLRLGDGKVYGAFEIFRTFWLMSLIRVFDVYADVPRTLRMFGTIFTDFGAGKLIANGIAPLGLSLADIVLAAVSLAAMIIAGAVSRSKPGSFNSVTFRVSLCAVLALAVIVFGKYGLGYDARQFIYNQF
ncbi:MAG: MBOAT family protein [Oscillospiraceae bacterium]|jgi:D-alanyl-lipoteichoic acid acyltransferase DltB (MBOAT superfamily)|nr:MBOAT family protein [Oscillospiraceae bacterium]